MRTGNCKKEQSLKLLWIWKNDYKIKLQIHGALKNWDRIGTQIQPAMLQPPAFRSAVIHTFCGNHDATVVRFGYQARRNSQESRGPGARSGMTISHYFLSNYERVSGVRGIRDSRSDRRTIFTPRGWLAKGDAEDMWGFVYAGRTPGSMAPHRAVRQFYGVLPALDPPVYRSVRHT